MLLTLFLITSLNVQIIYSIYHYDVAPFLMSSNEHSSFKSKYHLSPASGSTFYATVYNSFIQQIFFE